MTRIILNENTCLFEDVQGHKIKLFDINYLKNHSSFALYNFNSAGCLVPRFLELFKGLLKEIKLIDPTITADKKTELEITISLIIKQLFQQPLAYRVLEVGCDQGTLSYFIAKLLAIFDKGNQLLCLTNKMINAPGSQWLAKVSLLSNSANLSLLTTSYDISWFDQPVYDLIIINGNVGFSHSDRVLKSCLAALKKGGSLICLTANDSFLAESFSLVFSKIKTYRITKNLKVLTTTPVEQDYQLILANEPQVKLVKAKKLLCKTVAYIENNLANDSDESLKESIERLTQTEQAINAAQNAFKLPEIKNQVNKLKEVLVDCYVGNYQIHQEIQACYVQTFQDLKQIIAVSPEFN